MESELKKKDRPFKAERHMRIMEWLERHEDRAHIGELSEAFGVSPITIRRDLADLSQRGLVYAARGGVFRLQSGTTFEEAYHAKLNEAADAKEQIGRAAVAQVHAGETILLDGGTTVGTMAKYLIGQDITVATNALNVMNVLSNSRTVHLIAIGGEFRRASQTFLGPAANRMLGEFRFDRAFMGTESFSADRGLEVPDGDDAEYKQLAVHASREVWLVATPEKYGQWRLHRFAACQQLTGVITSSALPAAASEALSLINVPVIRVSERSPAED